MNSSSLDSDTSLIFEMIHIQISAGLWIHIKTIGEKSEDYIDNSIHA